MPSTELSDDYFFQAASIYHTVFLKCVIKILKNLDFNGHTSTNTA